MAIYPDTSAFASVFFPDVHTMAVGDFFHSGRAEFLVSDLTILELASVASRNVRSGKVKAPDAQRILGAAANWATREAVQVEIVSADYRLAEEYVRHFDLGLRPADALHVAICRRLSVTLLSCDIAQAKAACILGVETIELPGGSS